jgi:DHA1 family tetracycline resistance protein-like MFS transporter
MGFILGPPMSGLLSKLGTHHGFHENFAPGVAASFLSVCAFVVCLTSLPESKPPDLKPRSKIPPHLDRRMWSYIFDHSVIALILSSLFLIILSFAGMEPTVALFGADRFNFSPLDLGKFFGFMGVIVALIQGGLIGRITRMLGERTTVIIGAVSLTLGLLIVPSIYRVGLLYPSALLIAIGQGLCYPSLSSLLSQVSPPEQVGSMMGISSAIASLSRVIGPIYAGWLYDRWRAPGAFYGEALVVFLGLLLAIALRMQKIEYAQEKAVEPVEML